MVHLKPGETLANSGRTVYPVAAGASRHRSIPGRERRSAEEKARDTRLAATLPAGRAAHLADRFPPTRGLPGSGVGPLYSGEGRMDCLALLFLTVAQEAPGLVPAPGELAWTAELGEETAVDMACADLDRAARRLVDERPETLWRRVGVALTAGELADDWATRQQAARLAASLRVLTAQRWEVEGDPDAPGPRLEGVRQILDAVLVMADDGHAPGTRVRMLAPEYEGRLATVVGVHWGQSGPPVGYDVRPDGAGLTMAAALPTLVVLSDQEVDLGEVDLDEGSA